MYLVAEPVRLVLEVFRAYDEQRLSTDIVQKRQKFDGFTLMALTGFRWKLLPAKVF